MKNVVLIGMPSCGKSTMGVLLAKSLGYRFIDTDLLIQQEHGKLLSELIEEKGAKGFIAAEEEICSRLVATRSVIATGGSVVYGERAMQNLKSQGLVVYLKVELGELIRRLGDYTHRGVVMLNPSGGIEQLFFERRPLYERYADLTFDCTSRPFNETVEKLTLLISPRLS